MKVATVQQLWNKRSSSIANRQLQNISMNNFVAIECSANFTAIFLRFLSHCIKSVLRLSSRSTAGRWLEVAPQQTRVTYVNIQAGSHVCTCSQSIICKQEECTVYVHFIHCTVNLSQVNIKCENPYWIYMAVSRKVSI